MLAIKPSISFCLIFNIPEIIMFRLHASQIKSGNHVYSYFLFRSCQKVTIRIVRYTRPISNIILNLRQFYLIRSNTRNV